MLRIQLFCKYAMVFVTLLILVPACSAPMKMQSVWHDPTTNPGYWVEREYYVIESALYDNATDRLVWIVTSRTDAPQETAELSPSILEVVNERLSDNHFIAAR